MRYRGRSRGSRQPRARLAGETRSLGGRDMALKKDVTIELTDSQVEYLAKMVEKHDLADEGKAIRCLINFARESEDQEDDIFMDVRCLDC